MITTLQRSARGLVALVAAVSLAAPLAANAVEIDTQANGAVKAGQMNLAGLGFLHYRDVDGLTGPTTETGITKFQTFRCLGIDGKFGPETNGALTALMKVIQQKVGLPAAEQDGQNGEKTKNAIINWQRNNGLEADGMAGGGTFAKMGLQYQLKCSTPAPIPGTATNKPVQPVTGDSTTVGCAPGSRDLGIHNGAAGGKVVKVRICAITGLKSRSDESNPSSKHYIKGANGDLVMSSRVSGAVVAIHRDNGTLRAESGFRSNAHQKELCQNDADCRRGVYTWVARPGHSPHELGLAIDFDVIDNRTRGKSTCATKGRRDNAYYKWLEAHAKDYGFGQYAPEAWHWDARLDLGRC